MQQRGFTLVEMLIVITVILLITSVGMFSYSEASKRSRDTDRQADLRTLQAAVELYKKQNGQYPAGCRGDNQWSGQIGTQYACADGSNQYIVGLAPTYIPALPNDKHLNGTDSGYVYVTNQQKTVYKIEARKTVEAETVGNLHPLASCEINNPNHIGENGREDNGMCVNVYSINNGDTPAWCQEGNSIFQTSYAVWGGYANASDDRGVERQTENIVCAIP